VHVMYVGWQRWAARAVKLRLFSGVLALWADLVAHCPQCKACQDRVVLRMNRVIRAMPRGIEIGVEAVSGREVGKAQGLRGTESAKSNSNGSVTCVGGGA